MENKKEKHRKAPENLHLCLREILGFEIIYKHKKLRSIEQEQYRSKAWREWRI